MKHALILLIGLCAATPVFAQSPDAAVDSIIKESGGVFKQLTALDVSDKAIKRSNDAQVFSTKAANKADKEAKDAVAPLQMDAKRADQMRGQLLAMGCPENGGAVPIALAQRCNPLIAQHRALHDAVFRRAAALKKKMQMVATLRANISATTLKNAEQQRRNNDARARLTAQLLELKTRAVMAGLKNKVAAEKACNAMGSAEGQVCCHKVVFDGADPKTCGVELMCQAFERGGVFGGRLAVCRTASK